MTTRRALLVGSVALLAAPMASAQSYDFAAAARYSARRRGVSMLAMSGGAVVFEDYPNAGGADRAWDLHSGTKSFTGVMAAAAVRDNLLALDELAADTLAEWRGDPRKSRVTIRQLLNLTSGVGESGIGDRPTYAEAIAEPAVSEPGARFAYSPAPFQMFGEVIRRKTGADPLNYLNARLLAPMGVSPSGWMRGGDGMPNMARGAELTARAWARFGQAVLEGGRGLVDEEALAQCFLPSAANPGYGVSWWLPRPGMIGPAPGAGVEDAAEGLVRFGEVRMAAGAGDQRLYLLPERNLVVVRQANRVLAGIFARGERRWSDEEFMRLLIEGG